MPIFQRSYIKAPATCTKKKHTFLSPYLESPGLLHKTPAPLVRGLCLDAVSFSAFQSPDTLRLTLVPPGGHNATHPSGGRLNLKKVYLSGVSIFVCDGP